MFFVCKRLKRSSEIFFRMNSIFYIKEIAKFFILNNGQKILGGSAITAPGDTNSSDATGDRSSRVPSFDKS